MSEMDEDTRERVGDTDSLKKMLNAVKITNWEDLPFKVIFYW